MINCYCLDLSIIHEISLQQEKEHVKKQVIKMTIILNNIFF